MRRLTLLASLLFLICIGGTTYAADAVSTAPVAPPKMIAGKPYSITPGSKPGTYQVKWGDDSFTWEAKPWYEDTLKQQGPAYYAQWTAGKPFPFEVPIDQRDKLDPQDLMDRCIAWSYYGPYYEGAADIWNNLVIEPNGSVRETEHFMELYMAFVGGKNLQYLEPDQRAKVSHIYEWIAIDPEEVRGQSGVTTDFFERDEHPEDTWYTPTVRKVRRSGWFSFETILPRHNSALRGRLARESIARFGLQNSGIRTIQRRSLRYTAMVPPIIPEVKRVDGAGDVAVIIEITPKPGVSWWYAKRRDKVWVGKPRWIGKSGVRRKRATTTSRNTLSYHWVSEGKMPDGSSAPDWYQTWGALFVDDKKSGFKGDMWLSNLQFDPGFPTFDLHQRYACS